MSGAAPLVLRHPDTTSVAAMAGGRLLAAVQDAVVERGIAHVALTGGSMGSALVSALAQHPQRQIVDWSRVHVWWGDERYLPAGDGDRNDTQNDRAGLSSLGLLPEHVHRVAGPDTSASAEESAAAYEQALREHGAGLWDIVLLGVGPDGHVASLFPGHPAQLTADVLAVAVHDAPKPPPVRVTITIECLSNSREVWFVVAGQDKAEAVAAGVGGAAAAQSSAAQVRGLERTLWLVDEAAASRLA
ncbi:6-phosphogluconolactonase [Janibacter sp. Soil728]|uniref:6-phosphogluconolactonase n=1 Tax=Janibacter sp. Soil728 TaxID=1736393 RepID=UPI0006FEDBA1|nr:6-phosphogluconolactonase [Janibacter sp. Soil728]KRE37129.1 6-phosphogluconolactonase [Janibacter sp. Soil728]